MRQKAPVNWSGGKSDNLTRRDLVKMKVQGKFSLSLYVSLEKNDKKEPVYCS